MDHATEGETQSVHRRSNFEIRCVACHRKMHSQKRPRNKKTVFESIKMWQIVDGLYLGDRKDAADRETLFKCSISHILNCARTVPCFFETEIEYSHINVNSNDFSDQIDTICAFVARGRTDGKVLVHCSEARERSPAALIAYLCQTGRSVDESIRLLELGTQDRPIRFVPPPFLLMEPILDRFDP